MNHQRPAAFTVASFLLLLDGPAFILRLASQASIHSLLGKVFTYPFNTCMIKSRSDFIFVWISLTFIVLSL